MAQHGFKSWQEYRSVEGETLVCPVRVLWDDYSAYCVRWGFDRAGPERFVRHLGALPWVRLVEGGRGRRRRCAQGIGLRPLTEEEKDTA